MLLGVKASMNQATKKKRDSPPHLFQPFCVCIDSIVLSFIVFCFCSRPQKHQWVCCVFLSNLPHSSPSKPFLCKRALIFTTKTLNPHPHPHPCLHQSKPDRHHHHKIWPPSKQPLNKLSLQHKHIHPTIPWRLPPPPDMHLSPHCNYLLLFCNWWLCRLKSLGFLSERWCFNYIYKSRVSSGFTRILRVPGQPSGSRVNPPGRSGFSGPNP